MRNLSLHCIIILIRGGNYMLDYRLLTFMNLYQTMNYTRTAKNLKITQPAVTQHIKYLERAYNVKLFHYSRKHLTTTKEGDYLYRHATALQANSVKLFQDIQNLEADRLQLQVGASSTIAQYYMPTILRHMQESNLRYDVKLCAGCSDEMLKLLREGKIDAAFIEGTFDRKAYSAHPIHKEDLLLAVHKNHELASKTAISVNELIKYPLLHQSDDHEIGALLKQSLAASNLSFDNFVSQMTIDENEVLKSLIKSGVGIGFLYRSAIEEDDELVGLKVRSMRMSREFFMVYLNETINKDQFQEFYAYCQEVFRNKEEYA